MGGGARPPLGAILLHVLLASGFSCEKIAETFRSVGGDPCVSS